MKLRALHVGLPLRTGLSLRDSIRRQGRLNRILRGYRS